MTKSELWHKNVNSDQKKMTSWNYEKVWNFTKKSQNYDIPIMTKGQNYDMKSQNYDKKLKLWHTVLRIMT